MGIDSTNGARGSAAHGSTDGPQHTIWFECEDAVDRPAKGYVEWRDGSVRVVMPPPGSGVFGVDNVNQLAYLAMALNLHLNMLREEIRTRGAQGRSS